ncbi:MAG: YlxR family protein [Clostridia bacterium]|nr:YlxR family protein [Clostridia bacterium]
MCVVCRTMIDKPLLNRVVKTPNGDVVVDREGKIEGRGAYVCMNEACVSKCIKTKVLSKHLKVIVSDDVYQSLKINK